MKKILEDSQQCVLLNKVKLKKKKAKVPFSSLQALVIR